MIHDNNSDQGKESTVNDCQDGQTNREHSEINDIGNYVASTLAPYRLINLESHLNFVNRHLNACVICKSKGIRMVETKRIGLASSFMIKCDRCDSNYKHAKNQLEYFENKLDEENSRKKEGTTKKVDYRKLYYSVRYQKK